MGLARKAVPVSGLGSWRMCGRSPRRLFTDRRTLGEDLQGDPPAERIHSPQRRTSERPPPGTSASTRPVIQPSPSSGASHRPRGTATSPLHPQIVGADSAQVRPLSLDKEAFADTTVGEPRPLPEDPLAFQGDSSHQFG